MINHHVLPPCSKDDLALYINIPFCEIACPYCHYIANIKVGHLSVPDDYFKLLLLNLEDVCTPLSGCQLKSIYFGGGTPSLLSDDQLSQIRILLEHFNIIADEVSMELHPKCTNFTLDGNSFFTRYSIGAQSFDDTTLAKYRRKGYNLQNILELIGLLRENECCTAINVDLIFKDHLPINEVTSALEALQPDTFTVYPNTNGKGIERLVNICCTLRTLQESFHDYTQLHHSTFIFVRQGCTASKYSMIENDTFGDIIGVGHNSVTMVGNQSFLTQYIDGDIQVIERKARGDRYYNSILASLPTGVSLASVRRFFPKLLSGHILSSVISNVDINEKHTSLSDDDLVFLPEAEYIRFYEHYLAGYPETMRKAYLAAIGYGDSHEETITQTYNTRLLLSTSELYRLSEQIPTDTVPKSKLPIPSKHILVEGIDGSGKDTFVQFFVNELKRRFYYSESSTISIMGQPDSSLPYGVEAKSFIEDLNYETKDSVIRALNVNRAASEEKIQSMPGLCILIRGLVTDLATFNYAFPGEEAAISEGSIDFDYYIVIDVDPDVADKRIGKRGIPRTWREYPEHLQYFRNFYLNFNGTKFSNKTILENTSFTALKFTAESLANKIYGNEYINQTR